MDSAQSILRGEVPSGLGSAYLGYAAAIAAVRFAGLGIEGVVLLQIALAAIAGLALFDLGRMIDNPVTGFVASALFLGNPDLLRWHGYILTDSLYISLVCLATWSTVKTREQGGQFIALAVVSLGSAALVRPTGWLLLPIVSFYWTTVISVHGHVKVPIHGHSKCPTPDLT